MSSLQLAGIHHLKVPVADLEQSLSFYERALFARRIPAADHRRREDGLIYAYILEVPGLGTWLELRLHPERARRHAGFDSVTIAVPDRNALDAWAVHLDAIGARRSPVITAIRAWLIVVEDPDGNRFRLYTLETHGPELPADEGNEWLLT